MTQINEKEARLADKQTFPVWDFEGYNRRATKRVAVDVENRAVTEWRIESAHCWKESVGLVLARISCRPCHTEAELPGFDMRIDNSNINAYSSKMDLALRECHRTRAADVQEVEALMRQASVAAKSGTAHNKANGLPAYDLCAPE